MIKSIVVATDGSDHSRKAVELAGDLASKYSASLSILHVLLVGHVPADIRKLSDIEGSEEPALSVGGAYVDAELPREIRVDIAEKLLAQARERAEACGAQDIATKWLEGPTATAFSTTRANATQTSLRWALAA